MTLECLRSIIRETKRATFEIILVDNNSGDGIAAAVAQELPTVRIIALTENIGFARANNVAAANATGTYLLLLNPDTIVLDNAIDQLVDFARARPNAGIWGGRTLYGDRTLNPTSCWRRMTLFAGASGVVRKIEAIYHMPFLAHAPIRFVSAKTGKRVFDVLDTALALAEEHFKRVSTGEVNRALRRSSAPAGRFSAGGGSGRPGASRREG